MRMWSWLVTAFVILILQTTSIGLFRGSLFFDLPLIFIYALALFYGPRTGLLAGLLFGLLQDLSSPSVFGFCLLTRAGEFLQRHLTYHAVCEYRRLFGFKDYAFKILDFRQILQRLEFELLEKLVCGAVQVRSSDRLRPADYGHEVLRNESFKYSVASDSPDGFDLTLGYRLLVSNNRQSLEGGLGQPPAPYRSAESFDVSQVLLSGHELETLVDLAYDDAAPFLFVLILKLLAGFIYFLFIYIEYVRNILYGKGLAPHEHHRFNC